MIYNIRVLFRRINDCDEKDFEVYEIEANNEIEAEEIAREKHKFTFDVEFLPRTLNQLYRILYDKIKDHSWMPGVCMEIQVLIFKSITYSEYIVLLHHFQSQKPKEYLHPEFTKSDRWIGDHYWWNHLENYDPVNRKAFIQKMIEITK